MNIRKLYIAGSSLLVGSMATQAQTDEKITYRLEEGTTLSTGEHAPFWLTANRQGLASIERNSGYLKIGAFRPLEKGKDLSYSWGMDVALVSGLDSRVIMQQAYLDVRYKGWQLSVGSKERDGELKNQQLSSGALVFSGNARPIPQVRFEVPEYLAVPYTNGWIGFKGHIAYGRFTDDDWQREFVTPGGKRTENVLMHSKALYIKVGREDRSRLQFEGGLEMAAQFGGTLINGNNRIHMYEGIEDFWKVLVPASGGSSTPIGEQTNIYGNQLGSWNMSLNYRIGGGWNIRPYYQHYFEDHSMMRAEYAWKDGLKGIEITFPKNPVVSSLVYEYLGTKDQSGPVYWDATPTLSEQISATDDYYNHSLYTGWQHYGMGIGNPLVASPIYNKNGEIRFQSTRVLARHFGISGNPTSELSYRMLLSLTRNWGTYSVPFYEIKREGSALVEVRYTPTQMNGWSFTLAGALDQGSMLGNNRGGMLTITKRGFLSMKGGRK